ncbi:unnamed protein product [Rotaria sp. Silwood1]|nr:unnamed protein product [Rotaria sp. Silwood1]CAF4999819.1 unnamed protein product [Rotaria sp. Silwood1]
MNFEPPPSTKDAINQDVIWFRLFIQILIRMNDMDQAKNDLLQLWREECNDNEGELEDADEFERKFQPSSALWWYMVERALYRLIHVACYTMNYNNLYALRFIIKYLYLQLQEEHHQYLRKMDKHGKFIVYRGQGMPHEEFELLKTKIGELYPARIPFSTSMSRSMALKFAPRCNSNLVPVMFEIRVEPKKVTLPYAHMREFSEYPKDEEVLFMMGTIFQVNDVVYSDSEKVWIIKLSLCREDDPRLKDMIDYLKYEIKDTADLITLADFFIKIGEYDMAKEYYRKYQNQLSIDDSNMKRIWQGLSNIADIQGNYFISMNDYSKAHECFNEQIDICRNLPSHHPQVGKCYANIANLYELQGNNNLALENYEKAYKIFTQSLPAYHPDITKVEQSIENLSPQKKSSKETSNQSTISKMIEISEDQSEANKIIEMFLIVWLDANVNKTKDNEETYKALRTSINYLKTFDNLQEGETYIQSIHREKIILIVSGGFGMEIVPRIHDFEQVNCIYVYCGDKARHEQWSKDYSKVKSVITKRNQLVEEIIEDQKIRNKIEDTLPMSILTRTAVAKETTAKDIAKEMGSILWFQLLIDVLLRMEHSDDAKTELIKTWRENYTGNSSELNIIKDFEQKYKQEKAVWWYTRDSSLYRILNKALREQSIDMIFSFRFFLTELSQHVSKLYQNYMEQIRASDTIGESIHVYRGQVIAKEEFEQMQNSIGGFISINSFFSTSRNELKARSFAMDSSVTEKLRRILFKIEIDLRLPTKPFADIEGISYYPNEQEILFMLGSIFRINKIESDEKNKLSIINMNLCSEDDFELKELFAYLKKDIGEEASMITLGNILLQMGEYDKGEKIFLRMNHQEGLINVEELKGNFYLAMKQYKQAIVYYEQSLKLRLKLLPESHPDIGKSYSAIAMAYEFWKLYPNSIDYYQQAIKQYQRTLRDDHPLITQTMNNLQKLQHRTKH